MPKKTAPTQTTEPAVQEPTNLQSTPEIATVVIADMPMPPAQDQPVTVVLPIEPGTQTISLNEVHDLEVKVEEGQPAYVATPGKPEPGVVTAVNDVPLHNNLVHPAATQSLLRGAQTREDLIKLLAERNGPPKPVYVIPPPSVGQNAQRDAEMARGRERNAANEAIEKGRQVIIAARDAAIAATIAKVAPVHRPGDFVPNMNQGHNGARTLKG